MVVYTCEWEWDAILSCIHDAWMSRIGYKNIRIQTEPIEQYSLFDEYVHVDADAQKAGSVMDAVIEKISYSFYTKLASCAMAYEQDAADSVYRMMVLGFAYGPEAINMVQYREVMRFGEILKRVQSEAHHFREFIRFHEVRKSLYVAHIEPKSRVIPALADSFADRMPSEHWMIIDDVHRDAVIHPKNEEYYFRRLTQDELNTLLLTERENDEYTDLWKVFFDSIAIKERENYRCQRNLFPIWKRKHAVEFMRGE